MNNMKNKAKSGMKTAETQAAHASAKVKGAAHSVASKARKVADKVKDMAHDVADKSTTVAKDLVAKIKHDRPPQ